MRKFLYTIIALAATLLTTSCLYGLGSDDGLEIEDTSGLKVEVSSNVISADGEDIAVFRAFYNGEEVTSECTLYNTTANETMQDMSFSTYVPGMYMFYVKYQDYQSESITVTAVVDIDFSDKEESGLSVTLSTNLVQVSQGYAAFIVRYNGKVILPDEIEKVKKFVIHNIK